ncbi:MAG: DNA mismatch repair endonuclease MutL [Bacteroidales bacterium]|jgi:DNA mismatch repair protein MutL|nr:DNA mismatch repair endonuclease MutL [Bacteroidales bacterium]
MAIIKVLNDNIANQIAAGEVVNRPASVVKELMENSIDAGATQITLIVKDAGKTLIQIIDNGCGMDRDDAQVCFTPHATSKISSADDLYSLQTMGFRGEALASIAAISFVELRTKRKTDKAPTGTLVCVEGGEIKKVEEVLCDNGTSISVKNIFFNTPARRNFLKSDSIENSHITEEFIRIALCRNEIAFTCYSNDKLLFKLDKTPFRKRITDIFGKRYEEKLLPITEETDIVSINGFISKIDLVRKSKDEQYFFVNGRFMRHPYFANAISRAYTGLIPDGTHPCFVVCLQVKPENIDVNIHPSKTEIKFLDERFIYSILHAAAKRCLGLFALETQIDWDLPTTIEFSPKPTDTPPKPPTISYNPNYTPFKANTDFDRPTPNPTELNIVLPQPTDTPPPPKPFQTAQKYIVVPHRESLVIINQQRASFKVLYDRFMSAAESVITPQKLLFPHNHFFNPAISFRLLEFGAELQRFGFEVAYKADGSFDITATPADFTIEQSTDAIDQWLNDIATMSDDDDQRRHHTAVTFAQRLSIRNGQSLSEEEINSLLSQLYATADCEHTCLNERILIRISPDRLDTLFQ